MATGRETAAQEAQRKIADHHKLEWRSACCAATSYRHGEGVLPIFVDRGAPSTLQHEIADCGHLYDAMLLCRLEDAGSQSAAAY